MPETLEVRKAYRLQEWSKIVEACRASGLSNREFCKANGIPEKTFYYRLKQVRDAAVRLQAEPQIIQLEESIVEEPEISPKSSLHIRYCGATMDLPGGVDLDAVSALLKSIQTL